MKPEALPESGTASALDRLVRLTDEDGPAVHRDIFRDPEIFELEMKYIFERNWVYLAHESQVPNPNDFYSTFIGRTPVIVWRDGAGTIGVHINSCAHKGARVCHHQSGNARHFTCMYHGWTYDSTGANVLVKDQQSGAYADGFARLDHGLPKVKTGVYRGFIFGSLSDDVPTLEEHLGDVRTLLDLVADQGPDGMEMVPGIGTYTYRGNWKWQIENCVDGYHLTSCHPSFMNIVGRRKAGESGNRQVLSMDIGQMMQATGGTWTFPRGHAIGWGENPNPGERPLWLARDELTARVGPQRTDWMLRLRNLTVFPNVQFAENASLQCRIIRPLAVDRTEMTIFCVGVKGESDAARAMRLRQYEDFFNSSGLATPDDSIAYEDCQAGLAARGVHWQQGYHRGLALATDPAQHASALGICPAGAAVGTATLQDETVFHGYLRAWKQFITQGLARDQEVGP